MGVGVDVDENHFSRHVFQIERDAHAKTRQRSPEREEFHRSPRTSLPFPTRGAASATRVGWTAGAGIEHAFAGNWTVKAEYLHYDLGRVSYTAAEASPAFAFIGVPFLNVSTRVSGEIGRVGVNYRF
jgi:opacity protein-like surface antigen